MLRALILAAALASGSEDPATLFREAREAESRHDFRTALARYDSLLASNPRIAEVWANKGLVLYELERHREALRAFDKAAHLKPDLVIPHLFRGLEHLRFGEPHEALGPLRLALKLDPRNVEAGCALAEAYTQLADYEQAISRYRDVLNQQAGMERASYGLALAYLNYSKAVAGKLVNTGSGYGKLLMAEYLAFADAPDAAEASYRAALALLPGSPEVRAVRDFYTSRHQPERAQGAGVPETAVGDPLAPAITCFREREFAQAFDAFSQAKGERSLYWLSLTCRSLARELLARTAAANPDTFQALLLLADLARNTGDTAAARAAYERAAVLAPRNAEVQLIFIRFLAPREPQAALAWVRRALEKLPGHAELNAEAGALLLKEGNAREGAARFRRALESEPGLAAARAGLANAQAASGDLKRAIAEMEQAVGKDPDGSWHYRLATWYRETDRSAEARKAFAETARFKAAQLARQEARFLELHPLPSGR
jgi:Tfp pilus assembly protein PilF